MLFAAETKNANVNKNASMLQQLNLVYKWLSNAEIDTKEVNLAKYKELGLGKFKM